MRALRYCAHVLVLGAAAHAAPQWQEIALPDVPDAAISAVGLEAGGNVWAVVAGQPYYVDGDALRAPQRSELESNYHPLFLRGGVDRDLYIARSASEGNAGELFRLSDGRVLSAGSFYQDNSYAPPSIHVAASGQLLNWGDRFLAVRVGDDWNRIEALLHHKEPLILETRDAVHFYFNQNLYSVDRAGAFHHRTIDCPIVCIPGSRRVHGALLGDDRMLLMEDGAQELHAFDLTTGERRVLPGLDGFFERRTGHDLFRAANSAVWLLANDFDLDRFVFWELTADGELAPVEEADGLGWRNLRHWQYPRCVLPRPDGSVWLGTPRSGIARCREGEVESFGWKQGLEGEFRLLCEGPGATFYAASSRTLWRFDPSAPASARPAWVERWEEHRMASSRPLRDHEGNMWMFLADQPGKVSRWDGAAWTHRDVPFSTRAVGRMIVDDRGHLLVSMVMYPDGCYDVGPDEVRRFRSWEDLLVAAVEGGARSFLSDMSVQCMTPDGERIWFGYQGYHAVHYYDGSRWDALQWREPIDYIVESPEHEVLLRTASGRFLTYDRGQWKELPISFDRPGRWLLGPACFQPFEVRMEGRESARWLPVDRDAGGNLHALLTPDGARDRYELGPLLPAGLGTLTPGFLGGHWSRFPREPAYRLLGSRVMRCDFRDTPVLDRQASIEQILDDRAGNVWIDAGEEFGIRAVFLERLDDFEVQADEVPVHSRRSLSLPVDAFVADRSAPAAPIFWRIDDGEWRGGEPLTATIRFPDEGLFTVEIAAADPLGGLTPRPLRWTIDVRAREDPPEECSPGR